MQDQEGVLNGGTNEMNIKITQEFLFILALSALERGDELHLGEVKEL